MSIFSRFFGKADKDNSSAEKEGHLVANPALKKRLSLQIVFSGSLDIQAEALTMSLRAYHSSMHTARCDLAPDLQEFFGLLGWGEHVVQMVGFNAPYPADVLEICVAPAHYSQEVKEQIRSNKSHMMMYYAGYDESPLEQFVALAAAAGALSRFGALAVLNEHAHTSLPAGIFSHEELGSESLEILREFPLTMLYCGFVKYNVEGVDGVWMRTYGADSFGLPDFAGLAAGHHEGEKYSGIFNNILAYLSESGASMAAGHTMQVGESTFMKLRNPTEDEYFLDGPGMVLVAELIEKDQINLAH